MHQVYILQSLKDFRTYTGHAKIALKRLSDHNAGKVDATRNRRPLKLIYFENVDNLAEAKKREQYWKSGAGRRKLRKFFQDGFPPIEDGRGSPK